jgi:hypothetical protein
MFPESSCLMLTQAKCKMMSLFYLVSTDGRKRRRKIPWQLLLTAVVVAVCGVMLYRMIHTLNRAKQNRTEHAAIIPTEGSYEARLSASADKPLFQSTAITSTTPTSMTTEEILMPQEVRDSFDKASSVLRRAVQFSSIDSLATLVRHPDLTLPRYRAWQASRPLTLMVPLQIGPKFGTMDKLMVTTLRMQDGSTRSVVLEKTSESYLLDWESLAGWGECFFDDVPRLPQGQNTLLRVIVQPSNAQPPFAHEPGMTFILAHPEERMTLTAHAPASLLAESKAGQMLRTAADAPFTLRIAVDEVCLKHGWVRIKEIVCSGWVTDL